MNDLQKFEHAQMGKLATDKKIPDFQPGDSIRVNVKIVENTGKEIRHRIQAFEGVCIARGGKGIHRSFTVRKISYGEGVERVFPLFSPSVDSIELVRRGSVRRGKLYYLRGRSGKSARIAERERDTRDTEATTTVAQPKAEKTIEKKAATA